MAHRHPQRQKFVPKPKEIVFNINIWGDRFTSETETYDCRLENFERLLRAHDFRVQRASEVKISGNAEYIAFRLTVVGHSKVTLFEILRRRWCTSVCKPGSPFWLESSEVTKDAFPYRSDETVHVLQPTFFSLGSFFDRGTYIKHWSSEDDAVSIVDEQIRAEFEHDTKNLYITFAKRDEPEGFREIRLETEFKHFENYVLVDENSSRGTIEFYFLLQVPLKVFQGFSLFFAAIKTKLPRGSTEIPIKPTFYNFYISYALECLLSRGYKVRDRVSRKFYDLLRNATNRYQVIQKGTPLHPDRVWKALYHLVSLVETNRFCPLEYYLENLLYGNMERLTAVEFELPKHYVYVPRLIITPTQDYLVPPELVAENRVIREYGHRDAMRIAFREEDFSKLTSTYPESLKHVLSERVVQLLRGNIEIGGRSFEFLACSNSQLRDHGAWLYASDGEHTADTIRGSLGELDGIKCVATYVSRMGQCFSSTKEAITVNIDRGCRVEQIDDIKVSYRNKLFRCCNNVRSGTYTFSDGVGKISVALARKVSESLGLDPTPSAYQIRYGGCKGMLAIDPSLPGGEKQEILQYRESMKKFQSPHSALEICETTKPNLLYLNRQCILLLSGLGVADESFIRLQDKMLRHLASMLLFETVALETLRHANIPGGIKVMALSRSGVNVTREPFFRSLLMAIYKSRLGDLLRRARIAIPESHGRLLMGVLDETGSLEYGQVFVRYSKLVSEPGRNRITLKQKVVISKNPCFHPGDMRTFDAVDVRALHHLVDCIVFPAKGPRPHTDEMSGSDLDGDKYFVTWYDKLIPPQENEEPMDFTSPEKITLSRPVEVSDMIQFVADYIKNDQLGIIANAHLVHADNEKEGIFSQACVQLAHMHSDAVDFPKTGKCPSLPKELRPDGYPDFMMKPGKPQYTSQNILGQLFRKCKSLDRAQRYAADSPRTQAAADNDMIVPGYEQYLEEAKDVRDRYNTKLETLMSLYGLQNEGEVITGCLVRVNTRVAGKTNEKFEVAQMIQASLSSLRTNTRHEFYEEFDGEDKVMEEFEEDGKFSVNVMRKASAWYMATYQLETASSTEEKTYSTKSALNQETTQTGNKVTLLSFPWLVDGVLARIKLSKQKEREAKGIQRQHAINEVGDIITDQAAYYFEKFQRELIDHRNLRLEEKQKFTSIVERLLGGRITVPHLSLFGSSLTGISVGEESGEPPPTEIYAHLSWNASNQEQRELLQHVIDCLRPEGTGELLKHPTEAIFTRSRGRLLKQQFRITADPQRMLKSAYVSFHVHKCPRLLHLLLIVMHWGRRRHLNGNFKNSFLSNEDLAILFVVFCEKSEFIDKVEQSDLKDYISSLLGLSSTARQDEMEELWNSQVLGDASRGRLKGFRDKVTPGHALIKFFEHYSALADDDPLSLRGVKTPASGRNEKLFQFITMQESVRFSDAALHAFHELGQYSGLDSVMRLSNESTRELQETLNMPNTTWGALRFAEEFVAAKLSTLTEAQIFIRPAQRSSGYILEATGNYLTLHGVQNELERLETTCKSWIYNHTVSGAPQFLFLNQTDETSVVTFKKLQRDYAVNMPALPLVRLSQTPDDLAERKFVKLLSSQLQTFRKEYLSYVHGTKSLRIKAEFGSIYVENVNFTHSTVGAVERELSRNADPKMQSSQARNQLHQSVMKHKFIPLQNGGGGWTAVFPLADRESSQETYTLGIKAGNKVNQTMSLIFDSNLDFCDIEIPPIRWMVTDVKSPRNVISKSRDIDFRITVTSHRKLEGDEKESVMKSATYEKFRSKPIITKGANQELEVAREFQSKLAFVRHDTTELYRIRSEATEIFLQLKTGKKYFGKNARVLTNPKPVTDVQLWADLDSESEEEATAIAKNMWNASKKLRPHIAT